MNKQVMILLGVLVVTGILHVLQSVFVEEYHILLIARIVLHTLLIVLGARYLAMQAVRLSQKSPLAGTLVGVALLSVCAALPELVATLTALFSENFFLPVHIVVGANITTLLLVGGGSILMAYLPLSKRILTHEIPYYILAMGLFAGVLALPAAGEIHISRIEGAFLIASGVLFLLYNRKILYSSFHEVASTQGMLEGVSPIGILVSSVAVLIGGALIIPDATIVVQTIGLSQYLVGTALVALSTTLPELVIAYTAARNNSEAVALGSMVGSNMFNVLFVSGINSLIKPLESSGAIYRDIAYLFIATVLLFLVVRFSKRREIYHVSGFLLVGLYVCYVIFLIHR